MPNIGSRVFKVRVTDKSLIKAYNKWLRNCLHPDNPGLDEILRLRKMLSVESMQDMSMVCTFWLRDVSIQLRKSGLTDNKRESK